MTQQRNKASGTPSLLKVNEVAPYEGPTLVYGLIDDQKLVVVPRDWAVRGADEFDRWLAARTWRDALKVAESMAAMEPPIVPDEVR